MRRRAEQVNEVGVAGRLSVAEAGLKEHWSRANRPDLVSAYRPSGAIRQPTAIDPGWRKLPLPKTANVSAQKVFACITRTAGSC